MRGLFAKAVISLTGVLVMSACTTMPDSLALDAAAARMAAASAQGRTIAIRYPAVVLEDARVHFDYHLHHRGPPSPDLVAQAHRNGYRGSAALSELSSTYHAAQLYLAIRRIDPTLTIVLEPHAIKLQSGELVSAPIGDPKPHADVSAYLVSLTTTPNGLGLNLPQLSIQTSPKRSRDNCGFLFVSGPAAPLSGDHDSSLCGSSADPNAWISSHVLDGIERSRGNRFGRYREALPLSSTHIVVGPTLATKGVFDFFTGRASAAEAASEQRRRQPLDLFQLEPVLESYASLIVAALAVPEAPSDLDLHPYIMEFDRALADKVKQGARLSPNEASDIDLIRRISQQELRARAARDFALVEEILGGSFGRSYVRARAQARAEVVADFWRFLGSSATDLLTLRQSLQSSVSTSGAFAAASQYTSSSTANRASEHAAYLRAIAPSVKQAAEAQLVLLGDNVSVDLSDLGALRATLLKFYLSKKRS